MITGIYGIKDLKADAFPQFFPAPADGVAIRMFDDMIRDKGSLVSRHAADFVLWLICRIDATTGEVVEIEAVQLTTGAVMMALKEA